MVNVPEKPIIRNGPHDEYQMNIWYIPKEIRNFIPYNFVMDIIDHFSKWIWSYPLIHKNATESLKCLKNYVYSFGRCNILHTDNGMEFKNSLIEDFCIKNKIQHIYNKPYSPKSTGAVEASHKLIKRIVIEKYYICERKDEFDIEEALLTAINYHNNAIHGTTKFKPIELKDLTDDKFIELVKENIKNNVVKAIKYKNNYLLSENDYLLINNNIKTKIKNKEIYIYKNKDSILGEFIIPAKFINYSDDNLLTH